MEVPGQENYHEQLPAQGRGRGGRRRRGGGVRMRGGIGGRGRGARRHRELFVFTVHNLELLYVGYM